MLARHFVHLFDGLAIVGVRGVVVVSTAGAGGGVGGSGAGEGEVLEWTRLD